MDSTAIPASRTGEVATKGGKQYLEELDAIEQNYALVFGPSSDLALETSFQLLRDWAYTALENTRSWIVEAWSKTIHNVESAAIRTKQSEFLVSRRKEWWRVINIFSLELPPHFHNQLERDPPTNPQRWFYCMSECLTDLEPKIITRRPASKDTDPKLLCDDRVLRKYLACMINEIGRLGQMEGGSEYAFWWYIYIKVDLLFNPFNPFNRHDTMFPGTRKLLNTSVDNALASMLQGVRSSPGYLRGRTLLFHSSAAYESLGKYLGPFVKGSGFIGCEVMEANFQSTVNILLDHVGKYHEDMVLLAAGRSLPRELTDMVLSHMPHAKSGIESRSFWDLFDYRQCL
ncbi:hypothetical protein P154DRAFT_540832 [Amniculicola lignicola CBS 123094]|uniref:Uncharacterized protein n=1 Tax=Amniculicola lignicola CBS 123094 TaxID=1392246 RepID=A0A6A5VYJ6_9PLEO|nr:hypothetical protein P154DRAFT_540832 [Amniculicola lignicola CBS 123094]